MIQVSTDSGAYKALFSKTMSDLTVSVRTPKFKEEFQKLNSGSTSKVRTLVSSESHQGPNQKREKVVCTCTFYFSPRAHRFSLFFFLLSSLSLKLCVFQLSLLQERKYFWEDFVLSEYVSNTYPDSGENTLLCKQKIGKVCNYQV